MVYNINVFSRGVWDINSDHSCQVTLEGGWDKGIGGRSLLLVNSESSSRFLHT